ncbi:MAG: hypothetical protein AABY32_03395 [Nanoarchaeota archaeon]
MKKSTLIIILIILLLIILAYFFYPGCAFHRVGSIFEGQNVGEVCYCKIANSFCVLEGTNVRDITDADKIDINKMFSNN